MKICILTASLNHGGASVVALDIARGMSRKGHEVSVICSGKKTQILKQNGYLVYILANKFKNPSYHFVNFILLLRLIRLLLKIRPNIVHTHNINLQTFSLATLILSRFYPMVWTLHDIWPLCLTGWPPHPDCNGMLHGCEICPTWPIFFVKLNRSLKETVYKFVRLHIVSPSQWLASKITSSNLSRHPLHIIYNGLDPEFFIAEKREVIRAKLGISKNKKVILFCGGKKLADQSPAWRKGWKYFSLALRNLRTRYDTLHLLYIGDRLELPPSFPIKVSFVEGVHREEMKKYYYASDLFVLPTLADHPALTVLEAMAFKTPVISTQAGGIPEAVLDNKTGLLCPSRNAKSLTKKIDYALSNPNHCSEMAEKAYQRFNKLFTFNRMIEQYEDVYKKTMVNFNKKQSKL